MDEATDEVTDDAGETEETEETEDGGENDEDALEEESSSFFSPLLARPTREGRQ